MKKLDRYAKTDADRILLRKTEDMFKKSERTYSAVYSGFLTPAEQTLIASVPELRQQIAFTGGYDEAERRLLRVTADEYSSDSGAPLLLYCAQITDRSGTVTHRDVLGALMGLGIKRETIGDIAVKGNRVYFFCLLSVAEYIALNLTKIGRYTVSLSQEENPLDFAPEKVPFSANVSSLRLDCVAAECFGLSRTKAAGLIRSGEVSVNWLAVCDPSRELHEGDRISLRGRGKAELGEITGTSKKGRLFVTLLKYR